jgi:hypothetical protein
MFLGAVSGLPERHDTVLIGLFYKWASQRFTRLSNITRHWRFSNPSFVFAIVIVVSALAWLESLHVFSPPAEAEHALAALGVLVGGSWTLYLFVLRKGFESALRIGCAVHTEECAGQFIVAIEVVLANIGNRRITAPAALSREPDRGWQNSFDYPADLQIKKLEPSTNVVGPKFANWWYNDGLLADVENIPAHISLLDGFRRRYGSSEIIEFIMEPGERYELTSVCVLPPGHYIAKVVFVGERSNEFWCRTRYFSVPTKESSVAADQE